MAASHLAAGQLAAPREGGDYEPLMKFVGWSAVLLCCVLILYVHTFSVHDLKKICGHFVWVWC